MLLTSVVLLVVAAAPTRAHEGSCDDHTPDCGRYAAAGWCESRQEFMRPNCPVTCNLCVNPECYDRNALCGSWARSGHCQVNRDYMLRHCPHSCDACRTTAPIHSPNLPPNPLTFDRPSIVSPNFDCGRGRPAAASLRRSPAIRPLNVNTRRGRQVDVLFPDELSFVTGQGNRGRPAVTRLPSFPNTRTQSGPLEIGVGDTFCGATPISDRFLLTAAHCVFNPDQPVRTVRLGELDFSRPDETNSRPVDYDIQRIYVHDNYRHNSSIRYNDIALLETEQTIAFNEFVFPYCLTPVRPAPDTDVTGAGFGRDGPESRPTRLQEADMKVVDAERCEQNFRTNNHEPVLRVRYPDLLKGSDIMCASFPKRSACEGDSGGPLYLDQGGRRFLVGIISSGVSCSGGASSLPGLYVSVADHIDFIDRIIYNV